MRKLFGFAVCLVACRGANDRSPDAAIDAVPLDAFVPIVDGDDGTPIRMQCTNELGDSLTAVFGRLDGELVSIVQPGNHDCNGDDNHVHLQVRANDEVYDIAVNVGDENGSQDVHTTTAELALPVWSEGWHPGVLNDYPGDNVHSATMPLESLSMLTSDLNADLANVNHISIFATGYGPDGAHLVHRDGQGHDGMVVTQPLSSPSHARLFAFSDQSF